MSSVTKPIPLDRRRTARQRAAQARADAVQASLDELYERLHADITEWWLFDLPEALNNTKHR